MGKKEGMLHENEAAEILYGICKMNICAQLRLRKEKLNNSRYCGLLKIDTNRLRKSILLVK
jgi:hypothetical protein